MRSYVVPVLAGLLLLVFALAALIFGSDYKPSGQTAAHPAEQPR